MVENTTNGRRGAGTQNHCMHGKDAIIEDILAWRPFEDITLTTLLPVPGAPKILMSYAFDERASGGAHFEVRGGGRRSYPIAQRPTAPRRSVSEGCSWNRVL